MHDVPVHVHTELAPQHSCCVIFSHGRVQTLLLLIHIQFGSLKQSRALSYLAEHVGLQTLDDEFQLQSWVVEHVSTVSVAQFFLHLFTVVFQ